MGMEYFKAKREMIRTGLAGFMKETAADYRALGPWGEDVAARLDTFTAGGKMIRGALVFLGAELSGTKEPAGCADTALAMELLQSAFLIHDDIMDRDTLRRGSPSLFWQYRSAGADKPLDDPLHYGESMGICAGDVALFLAFRLLTRPAVLPAVAAYSAREVTAVGLAQMQDVHFGAWPEIPGEEEILTLYRWKTGRYSFSLPLACGAMLAGASGDQISRLEAVGENMGIAFQMRDDELGLFGDEKTLGKPIGSDIREGKKTLILTLARARMDDKGKKRLGEILGNPEATADDFSELRNLAEAAGVRQEVSRRMTALAEAAETLIEAGGFPAGPKETLLALLRFVTDREH